MKLTIVAAFLVLIVGYAPPGLAHLPAKAKKPNFVLLMVDDLGMGDVGCYGNDTIRTPNMDSIAKQGVKLSQHVVPAPLCTPSRAAFVTGRHPVRSGMLGFGRLRMVPFLAATAGLPSNETTFAEALKEVGYKTALIGKWHMGMHCSHSKDYCHHPIEQGFDYFYGLPLTNIRDCGEDTSRSVITAWNPVLYENIGCIAVATFSFICLLFKLGFVRKNAFIYLLVTAGVVLVTPIVLTKAIRVVNCVLMRNYDVVEQPLVLENITLRLTKEATQFIEKNQNDPFVLFMSYVKVHTALFTSAKFTGVSRHGRYGDNIEEADWSVGQILSTLDRLGLTGDTFVYLTSDNGGHLEESGSDGQREGGHNGIFRGGKAQVWEGGLRVPTLAMYPGIIPANTEVSEPTSIMDVFPTVLKLAGVPLPSDRVIDGKDFMPLVTKQRGVSEHEFLFHYCGIYMHAVRYRPREGRSTYKVYYTTPNWTEGTEGCFDEFVCQCWGSHVSHHDPPLVFDLTSDPGERTQLGHDDPRYMDIVKTVGRAVQDHLAAREVVPLQYTYTTLLWYPWLQPCCNFPLCYCREDENITEYL